MAYIEQRNTKAGAKRYRALVRLRGHPPQSATFERKTDAKKWAQQTESAIREGRYFKTSAARRHTGAELIDRYVEEVLPRKPKSAYLQHQQLRWWQDEFGAMALADITPQFISECRGKLANGTVRGGVVRSPGTVNRYLAALSHAFSIAVREWGWLEELRSVKWFLIPR